MIFLSYTWRDQSIAHEVDLQLRQAGFEVWIDHRNLRPDADILRQLDKAIRNCDIFVTVTGDSQFASPWMHTELSIARTYGKIIFQLIANPQAFAARVSAVIKAVAAIEMRRGRIYHHMHRPEEPVIKSSGNVFADLGLKDADELLVCAELTHIVHAELRDRRIASAEAARLLGIDEAEAVQLIAGRFVRFSTDRLLHLLTTLEGALQHCAAITTAEAR